LLAGWPEMTWLPRAPRASLLLHSTAVVVAAVTCAPLARAQLVYGEAICPPPGSSASWCDQCNAGPVPCNIVGQTSGTINACPAGGVATVSESSQKLVVSDPTVYLLHWGSYWTAHAAEAQADLTAWRTFATDWRFWQPLSEYAPINYGSASIIGFGASTIATAIPFDSNASAQDPGLVTDTIVQNELANEFQNYGVPLPDGHRIYAVVLPPWVATDFGMTGYHSAFQYGGQWAPYAVVPLGSDSPPVPNPNYPTATWRSIDLLLSHEVYEAVSDELPAYYNPTGIASGWSTSCGGATEIADLCEAFFSDPIDGYTVATFWSDSAQGCVGPANLDTGDPPPPASQCGGACNVNTDTLVQNCAPLACVNTTLSCSEGMCCPRGWTWDGSECAHVLHCPRGSGDCGGYCCVCRGTTCS
jgi:hypothetical protein